jgi:hypothetical protein
LFTIDFGDLSFDLFTVFVFYRHYLVNPGDVPPALELRGQEFLQYGRKAGFTFLGGKAANLGVVMEAGAHGGKSVVALGRPYSPHLIGGDAHADAGAAYQDTTVELAPDDGPGDFDSDVGIIDGIVIIAAEVLILVSFFREQLHDRFFQDAAAMVAADGYTHGFSLPRLISRP